MNLTTEQQLNILHNMLGSILSVTGPVTVSSEQGMLYIRSGLEPDFEIQEDGSAKFFLVSVDGK